MCSKFRRSADDLKIWEAAIKLIEDGPLVNRSIDGIERRSVLTWNGATNRSKDGQGNFNLNFHIDDIPCFQLEL